MPENIDIINMAVIHDDDDDDDADLWEEFDEALEDLR